MRIEDTFNIWLKCIFYGIAGTGKTTLTLGAHLDEEMGPLLYLDSGGNALQAHAWFNPPTIVPLSGYPDRILEILKFLQAGQPKNSKLRTMFKLDPDINFKTVAIDLFSDWQRSYVQHVTSGDVKEMRTLDDIKAPEALVHGGKIQAATVQIAKAFLDLPMNVILVMQLREVIDFSDGTRSYAPFLYGSSKQIIPHYVTLVGMMEMISQKGTLLPKITFRASHKDTESKNQIAPSVVPVGKNKYQMKHFLSNEIIDPNMTAIREVVQKHYIELFELQKKGVLK